MDSLPTELVIRVWQLSTPGRKRALLGTCRRVAGGIHEEVRECVLSPDEVPMVVPALGPLLGRFPRLASVRVHCSLLQLTLFLGASDFAVFDGGHGRVRLTGDARASLRDTCVIRGPSRAVFRVGTAQQAADAASIASRCVSLLDARFFATAHTLLKVGPVSSRTITSLRLARLGCGSLHLPSLRELEVEDSRRTVCLMDGSGLARLSLYLRGITSFCGRWPDLRDLRLSCTSLAAVVLTSLPLLENLSLTRVDVTVGELATTAPSLRALALVDCQVVDHPPLDVHQQALEHPALDRLEVLLGPPSVAELAGWYEVIQTDTALAVTGSVDGELVRLVCERWRP